MHRHLGPGLLESTHEHCLCHELSLRGLSFERQRPLPLIYKGAHLERGDRLDVTLGGEQRRRHRGGGRRHPWCDPSASGWRPPSSGVRERMSAQQKPIPSLASSGRGSRRLPVSSPQRSGPGRPRRLAAGAWIRAVQVARLTQCFRAARPLCLHG
ncbi:GxxExxY protein [Sorangium sp. So ce362]|uniref:GxxExxY protein n=1 Tax=Sorangium sp. So ce362 TaxID=3133303 RepID=UPI003F614AD2